MITLKLTFVLYLTILFILFASLKSECKVEYVDYNDIALKTLFDDVC